MIARKVLRKYLLWEDSPNFPDTFPFPLKNRNTGASLIHLHFLQDGGGLHITTSITRFVLKNKHYVMLFSPT